MGRQRRFKTRQSLRELDKQDTVFLLFSFVGGRHGWRSSLDHFVLFTPHKGDNRITQCDSVYQVHGKATNEVVTRHTHCCLWKWPHQKTNKIK